MTIERFSCYYILGLLKFPKNQRIMTYTNVDVSIKLIRLVKCQENDQNGSRAKSEKVECQRLCPSTKGFKKNLLS